LSSSWLAVQKGRFGVERQGVARYWHLDVAPQDTVLISARVAFAGWDQWSEAGVHAVQTHGDGVLEALLNAKTADEVQGSSW
jgi:hypothetical protein